jgi:RNA polymerase sigma factor (sigma-70 family)
MNGTGTVGVHGSMETAVTIPQAGFEDFFEAEHPRLRRALYLLTGNAEEADEVLQDAFVAVWERWDRVGAMDDPTGYLYRTALNRHRSALRRTARAARRAVGQAHGPDLFAQADERDALARALSHLSPRRREAIVLTVLLGYGSAEAAAAMGISDVTVRRLAQEAREHLRRELEETHDG